ncbi:peritrophin-44 [Cochliomyia hominivorax]
MKALQFLILFTILIATFQKVWADVTSYTNLCRLFKNNTKLRLPGSCTQYIECNGQSGQILSCGTNLKFNEKTGKCEKDLDTTLLCENRCYGKNGTWVANPVNCQAYYYCDNGQAFASSCNPGQHFNQQLNDGNGMCVSPKYSTCIQNMVNNICELVPDGTKFRNEYNCAQYYVCKKNEQKLEDCQDKKVNTYFNIETGNCEDKSNVPCDFHVATSGKCKGLKINKDSYLLVSDGFSCRGYFTCLYKGNYAYDLEPVWSQCPVGTFFNDVERKCTDQLETKCKYDRCDGHGDSFSTSEKNNCRNYLICKDNRKISEMECPIDYFFDERSQACVTKIIYYKSCDQTNTHV